eukprot:CAMPEP_0205810818 /NCGR_PEP_ID=MMETSP0205-20121125/14981_1 /ASSEMBLY_ACC=CAM_ASM_000278 /TAXON_ID=36767 /ORGANISM="Euplotes focardii, Strain TN1" /LENGTH=166 /DNA_ID=CAMNT_0053089295 /DNA_START=110 /DNA_END=607 /DNA_ORIENTATION=+
MKELIQGIKKSVPGNLNDENEYMVSYYSNLKETFVYKGLYPKLDKGKKDVFVNSQELIPNLILKFRIKSIPLVDEVALNIKSRKDRENIHRRTKERKIGDVVTKVIEWRKLYNSGDEFEGKKYSLDDAAKAVGMSKKSLDDYLLQIRCARKFGFNFNEHKEDKIGI